MAALQIPRQVTRWWLDKYPIESNEVADFCPLYETPQQINEEQDVEKLADEAGNAYSLISQKSQEKHNLEKNKAVNLSLHIDNSRVELQIGVLTSQIAWLRSYHGSIREKWTVLDASSKKR